MGRRSEHDAMNYYALPSDNKREVKRHNKWAEGRGRWWIIWLIIILLFAPLLIVSLG